MNNSAEKARQQQQQSKYTKHHPKINRHQQQSTFLCCLTVPNVRQKTRTITKDKNLSFTFVNKSRNEEMLTQISRA